MSEKMDEIWNLLSWEGWFVLALFALLLVLLFFEWRPPYITMLLGAFILVLTGILNPWDFLEGFTNETLLTIAFVCIVVRANENQGVVRRFVLILLGQSSSYAKQLLSLLFPVSAISAFFNNTPVVLFLTPIVREWALKAGFSPSKFLIPLSYASLMGGMCTLIGTSTNLVVQSLLVQQNPLLSFGFFELAKVGLPLLVVGYLYLLVFGNRLLPSHLDPLESLEKESKEYMIEFTIPPGSPFAGKPIRSEEWDPFGEKQILLIQRKGGEIDAPGPEEILLEKDRLVFTGTIQEIAELHTIEGLQSEQDPTFSLNIASPHFAEILIPNNSSYIGKTLQQLNFRRRYGASVFAIYRQGKRLSGQVATTFLRAGDALMLLSNADFEPKVGREGDILVLNYSERVALFHPWKGTLCFLALFCMILGAIWGVPIFYASLAAASFLFFTKCITLGESQRAIPWTLLLLIVSALAFGKALQTTGAAHSLAKGILQLSGTSSSALIATLLLLTLITTELITNNAAVLLMFPLAIEAMHLAGFYSVEMIKMIGVAIAVAGSSGFALPTGYQTHLIVYGPGGYRFRDFLKIGLPLDLLFWITASLLIPWIWGSQ